MLSPIKIYQDEILLPRLPEPRFENDNSSLDSSDIVYKLLKKGADINAVDNCGWSPLMYFANKIVKYIDCRASHQDTQTPRKNEKTWFLDA